MTPRQVPGSTSDRPMVRPLAITTARAASRRPLLLLLWLSASLWLAAIGIAPLLAGAADTLMAVIYAAGSFVCHQQAARSFHVAGAQLPVCARCVALYAGGAIGLGGWWVATRRAQPALVARRVLWWAAVAAVPVFATVGAALVGWWDASNLVRALTSWPLGVVAGVAVAAVVTDHLR